MGTAAFNSDIQLAADCPRWEAGYTQSQSQYEKHCELSRELVREFNEAVDIGNPLLILDSGETLESAFIQSLDLSPRKALPFPPTFGHALSVIIEAAKGGQKGAIALLKGCAAAHAYINNDEPGYEGGRP